MKLVWCPETASKAYIDAVKALSVLELDESDVAELVSAMAGGWKSQLVVEAWSRDSGAATSIALRSAVKHARGRHVCVVPDDASAAAYADAVRRAGATAAAEAQATITVVGDAEQAMRELEGVDLVVVDCRQRDAWRVLRAARPGPKGMVVVCKGAGRRRGAGTAAMITAGKRVVRSTYLHIGSGVEVLHVGVGKGPSVGGGRARWIKHVDLYTKEEHVFRPRR